ncbi:hypothetical protein [Streptomyces sp. KR55]|uniref:hypothetical protein n=1 Tax=Streptomyces sp. KR55 TaxID=3457425 RepID=UPI003FD0C525
MTPAHFPSRPLQADVDGQAGILDLDAEVLAEHMDAITRWLPVQESSGEIVDLGRLGVPLYPSSSPSWSCDGCFGGAWFVEDAVAEHGEEHADAVAGEAEEGLGAATQTA